MNSSVDDTSATSTSSEPLSMARLFLTNLPNALLVEFHGFPLNIEPLVRLSLVDQLLWKFRVTTPITPSELACVSRMSHPQNPSTRWSPSCLVNTKRLFSTLYTEPLGRLRILKIEPLARVLKFTRVLLENVMFHGPAVHPDCPDSSLKNAGNGLS